VGPAVGGRDSGERRARQRVIVGARRPARPSLRGGAARDGDRIEVWLASSHWPRRGGQRVHKVRAQQRRGKGRPGPPRTAAIRQAGIAGAAGNLAVASIRVSQGIRTGTLPSAAWTGRLRGGRQRFVGGQLGPVVDVGKLVPFGTRPVRAVIRAPAAAQPRVRLDRLVGPMAAGAITVTPLAAAAGSQLVALDISATLLPRRVPRPGMIAAAGAGSLLAPPGLCAALLPRAVARLALLPPAAGPPGGRAPAAAARGGARARAAAAAGRRGGFARLAQASTAAVARMTARPLRPVGIAPVAP